eukprot:11846938-Prorocentrum_lima.AAC.1
MMFIEIFKSTNQGTLHRAVSYPAIVPRKILTPQISCPLIANSLQGRQGARSFSASLSSHPSHLDWKGSLHFNRT